MVTIPGKPYQTVLEQLPLNITSRMTAWRFFMPPLIMATEAHGITRNDVNSAYSMYFSGCSGINAGAISIRRWPANINPLPRTVAVVERMETYPPRVTEDVTRYEALSMNQNAG